MKTATATTPETKGPLVKTAGVTVKGTARDFNAEYICNVSYTGAGRVKALFGIADGLGERGAAASETAVNSLKETIRQIKESDSVNGTNLLPGCLEEMHARLLEASAGEDKKAAAASIVCGYIEGDTAHLARAGGGAIFIVEQGNITRLTEKMSVDALEQKDYAPPAGLAPPGWPGDGFNPVFFSRTLLPGECLVLCSDGFDERIAEKTILDILTVSRTIDEAADNMLAEARNAGADNDMGVVIVTMESPDKKVPAPDIKVKYTLTTYTKKYIAVAALICALGAAFYFGAARTDILKKGAIGEPETLITAAHTEKAPTATALRPGEAGLTIKTSPADARVFINGVQQIFEDGELFGIPAGPGVELRVEADGFDPHIETLNLSPGKTLERAITLLASPPDNGSLLILCRPACDGLLLDDRKLEGFPKDELLLRQIPPGRHQVKATRGQESENRSLSIVPGITQSIIFRFEDERIIDTSPAAQPQRAEPTKLPPRTVAAPSRAQTSPLVVTTSPSEAKLETGYPPAIEVEGAGSQPSAPKLNRAYFNVTANVRNCSLMVFKNDKLALTGFCDTRHDLDPGEYVFQVSRPGWKTARKSVALEGEFKLIEIELEREQ